MKPEYVAWLAEFCREPLLIDANALDDIMAGRRLPRPEREAQHAARIKALAMEAESLGVKAAMRGDGAFISGNVAVVPVFGVIDQRASWDADVSVEALGATLEGLMADKQIRKIVMVYDSPGGSVAGIPELGERIRAMRETKPIIGMAYPMAASAALWLMAQSSEAVVTPSGQVGSVGVISTHVDASKFFDQMGMKVTMITSSPYKAEGHMFGPLDEAAMSERQSKVNHYHEMFIAALSNGRGVTENAVEKTFGRGRMLTPDAAKSVRMVDRVSTFADVLRRVGIGGDAARARALVEVDLAIAAKAT